MEELQRDQFAAFLRGKQAELLAGLNKRDGLTAEAEPDVFDESQRALDRALVIESLDRNSGLLREVRTALERIADGSYGRVSGAKNPSIPSGWRRFLGHNSACGARRTLTARTGDTPQISISPEPPE